MNDKISIIVPIYKVEAFLDRCVKSLVNQTYRNIEIVLVDDGSPDKCPQMCDFYAKEDDRIRVIHKENGGLSDARNAGLDIVTGEYIMFVDSDDYIELDLCETIISAIKDGYDIYSYYFRRFYSEKIGDPYVGNGEIKYLKGRKIFECYIKRQYFTHMVCDKVFRKKIFNGIRFIKGRLAEDLAICYQLFGKAEGAVYIYKTFYNYFTRENSIMGSASLKLCVDAYRGECEAYNFGNQYFSEYSYSNDIRLLNQSIKTYLKLKYVYVQNKESNFVREVDNNIKRISKKKLPLSTIMFYLLFRMDKRLAWVVHKLLKMS